MLVISRYCKWHSYSSLILSHGFDMSLMSIALSMVVLWKTYDAWTWFAIDSPRWFCHNFRHFGIIVTPRSLHSRWSLKACFHQWHYCVYLLVISKCWWFVFVFLWVVLVFWPLFVDGDFKGILIWRHKSQ